MTENSFWDPRKSATLSIVVTCAGLATAVACYPLMMRILRSMLPANIYAESGVLHAAAVLYTCLTIGVVALLYLLRLLIDIRRGDVFTTDAVRRLRVISYCGFAIMLTCAIGSFFTGQGLFFWFLAVAAGFLGLLMRVIKNVIESARLLKEDADYTI